jgi:hypothetical protein
LARFFGVVGFADATTEKAAGVFTDDMVEYSYYGDVVRDSRQLQDRNEVNEELTVGMSISIVADEYAREHIFAMRLGGVYNGPTAT